MSEYSLLNLNILAELADYQYLNRKQFNKLFNIKSCRYGLFSTNNKFLTSELIDKAITDGVSLYTLYEYNANKLNEQQLTDAVEKEVRELEEDISYLFDNRTKAVSDEFVEYCCGLVNTISGDDVGVYGYNMVGVLSRLIHSGFINNKQEKMLDSAIKELHSIIREYNNEMGLDDDEDNWREV